jgi:hypothetical protein
MVVLYGLEATAPEASGSADLSETVLDLCGKSRSLEIGKCIKPRLNVWSF